MSTELLGNGEAELRRVREVRAFLFLVVVLAPAISVAVVGALGFWIWISQLITGPLGPPA